MIVKGAFTKLLEPGLMKKLTAAEGGILDLSDQIGNLTVQTPSGLIVPASAMKKDKQVFFGFDVAQSNKTLSPPDQVKLLQDTIHVLKAMVAGFLVGRDDCTLEVSKEMVEDILSHHQVVIVWLPDENKYRVRLK